MVGARSGLPARRNDFNQFEVGDGVAITRRCDDQDSAGVVVAIVTERRLVYICDVSNKRFRGKIRRLKDGRYGWRPREGRVLTHDNHGKVHVDAVEEAWETRHVYCVRLHGDESLKRYVTLPSNSIAYCPTPEQIEERAAEVRKSWSRAEYVRRAPWAYTSAEYEIAMRQSLDSRAGQYGTRWRKKRARVGA